MYHFVTDWQFDAPVAAVWEVLGDLESFPVWWPNWKRLERRGSGPVGVGTVFDCEVRGSLPYSLRYALEIAELEAPYLNVHRSTGDLVGEGPWVLTERRRRPRAALLGRGHHECALHAGRDSAGAAHAQRQPYVGDGHRLPRTERPASDGLNWRTQDRAVASCQLPVQQHLPVSALRPSAVHPECPVSA